MKTILNLINVVEQNISQYDINNTMEAIALLVEEIFNILPQIDEKQIEHINNIFQCTNVALTNKDYLLYQDILEFELKPILLNMTKD